MRHFLLVALVAALVTACSSSSGTAPPRCYFDTDCDTAEQCKGGECVTDRCSSDSDCRGGATCQAGTCQEIGGCSSDADCNGWFCVAASCVQCQTAADCPQGQKCLSGVCRPECQSDADCKAPAPVCDWLTGACVACLSDSDCSAQLPACDTYRGVCLECIRNSHCSAGKICRDNACVAGGCTGEGDCTSSTPFCNLADHVCVECLENNDCSSGYHCDYFTCVPGECASEEDCPLERPYCDTQTDPSRCVQCRKEEDCANQLDTSHCLLEEGTCVQCFRNAHCLPNATCNISTHECVGGFTACSLCYHNRCQPGAFCATFEGSQGTVIDQGCVHICIDSTDCPKGYYCSMIGAQKENFCLPAYNRTDGTCEAIRDIGTNCGSNAECGVSSLNDAICVGGMRGKCTINCKADHDCPGTLQCVSVSRNPGGVNICGL